MWGVASVIVALWATLAMVAILRLTVRSKDLVTVRSKDRLTVRSKDRLTVRSKDRVTVRSKDFTDSHSGVSSN